MAKLKVGDKVKFEGDKHMIVNFVDGYPVLVPMDVIDDECFVLEYEGDGCHEFDLIPLK